MIKINMELQIDVKNPEEVINSAKGSFWGPLLNLPGVKNFSHSAMDKEVKGRIVASLGETLPSTIKEELQKNGINADVSVEFRQ